ncbi:hypothetical protein TNIN_271121 [Trichonephila inaurata madagascariensis]|uniref:Uncharacterized protein n=1 Tax=Trichonephila inaurata madagascariensis TaxID=2747483 RepID=A0A8X7BMZ4_9ARAC|nr:hypothetical protein TNIN_271121 [Trichonephila inaurata madagascariensis]
MVVMNPTLKYLFVAAIILSMISVSLATKGSSKKDNAPKHYRRLPSEKKPLVASLKRTARNLNPLGRGTRFCEIFGCESCNVPEEKRCCDGFSYDPRSKKCKVITS